MQPATLAFMACDLEEQPDRERSARRMPEIETPQLLLLAERPSGGLRKSHRYRATFSMWLTHLRWAFEIRDGVLTHRVRHL